MHQKLENKTGKLITTFCIMA